MTSQVINPCLCPLCGQPNHCAMEQARTCGEQAPCWCTREQFSAQLLQQLPDTHRDKACICQACVRASHAST